MELEEELTKIWTVGREVQRALTQAQVDHWGRESIICNARTDYHYYIGYWKDDGWIKGKPMLTASVIKAHLLEAMTSYNPYIQEWGRLIKEEMNEAERMSTACQQDGEDAFADW